MTRRLIQRCALILAFLCPLSAMAELTDDDIRLSIAFEPRDHPLMAGEMILMTIKGAYRPKITLEAINQPELEGFDWMQLGTDRWTQVQERGIPTLLFERRMALFPREPGTHRVPAFAHDLTLLSKTGERFVHRARSNSLKIHVVPPPADAGWFFPVREIEISDQWSNPPDRLEPGGGVLRIVTITAQGVEPELIPPMPELTGAGAFIFPHPEQRIVTLGPHGPITRAFWRWTIRPGEESAGFINPVDIPYFDTRTRTSKTITLSAQRVAYAGVAGAGTASPAPPAGPTLARKGANDASRLTAVPKALFLPAAFLIGLLVGATFLLPSARGLVMRPGARPLQAPSAPSPKSARHGAPHAVDARTRARQTRALKRAAKAGDALKVSQIGAAVFAGQTPPPSLTALHRALYAHPDKPEAHPPLAMTARAILARMRKA